MATVYDIGDAIIFSGVFRDEDGDLADPTALTFTYRAPDGTLTSYVYNTDPELVRDSLGTYHTTVTMDTAGDGFWRWSATGAVADSETGYFYVRTAWTRILTAEELDTHLNTDLTLSELEAIIAAESAYIDQIVGPAATDTQFFRFAYSPSSTDWYYSDQRYRNPRELMLARPALSITSIVERDEDEVSTTLASNDYRLINPFLVERLDDGTNQRIDWAPEVTVTFIPKESLIERRQALIEICKLTVASNGYSRIQDNEIQLHPHHRVSERLKIVQALHRGLPFL